MLRCSLLTEHRFSEPRGGGTRGSTEVDEGIANAAMDFQLTDEHRMVQRLAADFATREILPRAAELDHTGEFPRDLIRKAAGLGLMGRF